MTIATNNYAYGDAIWAFVNLKTREFTVCRRLVNRYTVAHGIAELCYNRYDWIKEMEIKPEIEDYASYLG